ncbi:response regulator [Tolumonas lignilytica]|jgi:Response regulator containing CheY-like receiver, AAA-type ATPase, and DNA-binding domains|uniref:response regulator n=1 Tax=Tolumonas lignilytica TaxID=1283284 RepID=UPI00046534AB|nr:response regulator [Tolumonas lignilytica]
MGKTVLVVDDSMSIRQLVKATLLTKGYNVVDASDGIEALSKLGSQRVNLVISDVNMPNMDGISLLKAIKAKPEHRFTPVIMLTTESQEAQKRAGQAAGAKAWIVKPFQPEQMLAAVEKLIM